MQEVNKRLNGMKKFKRLLEVYNQNFTLSRPEIAQARIPNHTIQEIPAGMFAAIILPLC